MAIKLEKSAYESDPAWILVVRSILNQLVDKWVLILNFNSEGETKTDLASNFHIHFSNMLTIYTVYMCRKCQKQTFFLPPKSTALDGNTA